MPSQTAISHYKFMWLYVCFDLPTTTKAYRHAANKFRRQLIKDGFTMMQLSVYIRHCASHESGTVHINRVKQYVPDEGLVSILKITDKQFGDIVTLTGRKRKPQPKAPAQLELF